MARQPDFVYDLIVPTRSARWLMQLINVYGADNCSDTEHIRGHLQKLGVSHRYFNIEEDSMAEDRVKAWNHGQSRTPTVVIQDESGQERLATPSDAELDAALARHGLGVR